MVLSYSVSDTTEKVVTGSVSNDEWRMQWDFETDLERMGVGG